jgi:sugar phosphate isomerase/epimerase
MKMKRRLGINANCLIGISEKDALKLIKDAGFDSIFISAYENDEVAEIKREADALGLESEFIHAPFRGINAIWEQGMGYLTIFEQMKQTVDSAANNGIKKVITHVSSGWNAPAVCDLGLARFDELVLYARERGVTLAFENLRKVGNLAYLADRYASMDNVRFCYDCGHENCYTNPVRWLDIFKDKVTCTHIHDNPGREINDYVNDFDIHVLPFDGTCDYERMMRDLDKYGYDGILTLEVTHNKPEYENWTPEQFLATCYERIKRISEM